MNTYATQILEENLKRCLENYSN